MKSAIDQIDCATGHRRRQERSEVKCAVVLNSSRDHALGKRFVDGELEVRIRLVVFQLVIKVRLMLFDQGSFEDEGFDLVIGDDDLNVRNLPNQFGGLNSIAEVARAPSLEIRTHPIAQVLGLADIDDLARGVLI